MADTVVYPIPDGTIVATQDEANIHYQEVKLVSSGTGTTAALTKAEDAAHTSGDHGIMALAVRKDTAAALAGTDADYTPLITDASGRLHVALPTSTTIKVGAMVRTYYTPQSLVCTDGSVHSPTVPGGATHADITMEGASAATDFVRYWHSATDPSATVGTILLDGQAIASADPATFTAIKGSTGGGGTLRIEYYSYA